MVKEVFIGVKMAGGLRQFQSVTKTANETGNRFTDNPNAK
jgi:hypothetical protein